MRVRNICIEWYHLLKSIQAHLVTDMAIQWEVNLGTTIKACCSVILMLDAKLL
jgi:hypothetical protein